MWPMRKHRHSADRVRRAPLAPVVAVLTALAASAWAAGPPSDQMEPVQPRQLTAKERLTSKAADEQRTNDCNVPVEQRGDSRRPDDCAHVKRPRLGLPPPEPGRANSR